MRAPQMSGTNMLVKKVLSEELSLTTRLLAGERLDIQMSIGVVLVIAKRAEAAVAELTLVGA